MADFYQPPMIVPDNLFLNDITAAPQCSICLEDVIDNDGRSIANLVCGHVFHLDCIGSEFNARGLMRCPNCREIEDGNWLFPEGEGLDEQHDDEEESEEEDEPEPLPAEQPVELRFGPPVEVETQVARNLRGTITSFPPRVFVLMGCAEHCPSSSQGCTRTFNSTAPLTAIHLQCQQPVMNVIVNAPTTIAINRNNTNVGNSTMPNGNGPAAAAANGVPIPLPIFQQLHPMAQNRSPLPPLSIRRRADDVAGTSREQAAPPPRNGPAPQPNEQASIYPEPNLALSLEVNSTYNEEHLFLCQRLESMNLERLRPIDETRLASEEEEEDKIRYPNMIPFF